MSSRYPPPTSLDDLPTQCVATSKRTGRRCERPPMRGGMVCQMHGGKAPQTMAAARRRLAQLQERAQDVVGESLWDADPNLKLKAAIAVLDRTGQHAKCGVEVTTDGGDWDVDELPLELRQQLVEWYESKMAGGESLGDDDEGSDDDPDAD